jgi:hypothetical protein
LPKGKSAADRFLDVKQELEKLQLFCKGTVLARMMKCGQPTCPCHKDAAKRHGPYWEWTYKSAAKTVNIRLSPAAGPIYHAAAQQHKQLKAILRRLETLSHTALAAAAKRAEAATKPDKPKKPRRGS